MHRLALLSLLACHCYFIIGCFAAAVDYQGLYVLHSPHDVKFSTATVSPSPLRTSQLPDLISASIGFTPSQDFDWTGLASGNPLKRPRAVAVVEFDGFRDVDLALDRPKFTISVDSAPGWAHQITADRIYERFPTQDLRTIEIVNDDTIYAVKTQYQLLLDSVSVRPSDLEADLHSEKSTFGGSSPQLVSLNTTNTPDLAFLLDVQLLFEVVEALPTKKAILSAGSAVDLFWFRFSSLQELIPVYGKDSPQVSEAVSIVRRVLKRFEKSFLDVYGDDVVLFFLAVDYRIPSVVLSRALRSLLSVAPTEAPNNVTSRNVALDYNEDYPAIFNIIFFTMLIISLSVFAIALGTWHMDPGRDSIIYRMTSQRIKKDQ